jgi:electron transfer flavoprotein beta subunit
MSLEIVVCGGLAPDPLQSLEPVPGPALKNEAMLPAVFDPWAAHALYEAGRLASQLAGTRLRVVSLGPKAKLQQVMMKMAQKLPFELVPLDGPANGFSDAGPTAEALAAAIRALPGLDLNQLLLFGGWESATRGAGVVMQMAGERLGITEQFLAVDEIVWEDGAFTVKERVEGGRHMVSRCAGPPAVLAWATGSLPEPPNHPQTGMANMRTMMPALQKAPSAPLASGISYREVALPKAQRATRIVKDLPAAEIARELAAWVKE